MSTGSEDIVSVRFMVPDVQAPADFDTTHLGLTPNTVFLPAFADATRGNLRLLLAGPGGQQVLLEGPSGNPVELFQPAGA